MVKKEQNTENFESWKMFNTAMDYSTPFGLFLSVFPICSFRVSLNITFFYWYIYIPTDIAVFILI